MLPAEMASVADRTRNRTPEVGQEREDNADDTVVAGEQGEDVDSTASTELDDLPDDHAYRILQKLTAEQVKSFKEMVKAMKEISLTARRHRSDDESGDSDESNYQDANDRIKIKRIRKRVQAPIFKGTVGERPEPHLLRATDWFDSQGIKRDVDKVYNFKHTLDGDAREWYADYIRERGTVPTWPTLINEFSRYYSTQGRGIKNLHDSWRKMTFEPETDDIEIFIRDAQECAKQLNYDDSVLMNMLKAAMPKVVYGTLYHMETLGDVIKFVKDYYSKSPSERMQSQQAAKTEASPFKAIKSPQPIDLNSTLVQLTDSLNKMDFTQKPYKPTLYPTGRGRGRGRGGRSQGKRFQARNPPYNPQNRGRGKGGFRGKPRGGKFDRSPTKRVPRENSKTKDPDKDRCRYCREIGHWVKDCPQKQKDMAKKDTESAFSGLNEIAQDFYADRTTDVFHGITEDYVQSEEEETSQDNGMEPQNQIDHLN